MLPNIIKDRNHMNFSKNVLEFNFTLYNSDTIDNFLSVDSVSPLKITTNTFQNLLSCYCEGTLDTVFSHGTTYALTL